jgi:hypothetical protein
MGRKRNSWDVMRRQSRVSAKANPTYMLDPRYISDEEVPGFENAAIPTSAANTGYIALEKRVTEALGISPVALKSRITEYFDIAPAELEKIIAGKLGSSPTNANPWVKHFKKINTLDSTRRILLALLSETEFSTLHHTEERICRAEERKRNPDQWSPYGRLNKPKKWSPS